jgi:hypothetical protein
MHMTTLQIHMKTIAEWSVLGRGPCAEFSAYLQIQAHPNFSQAPTPQREELPP